MKTKIIPANSDINLSEYPNFSSTGSINGMKKLYYGKNALLVKKGAYIVLQIYNVFSRKFQVYFVV